jgi:hypothetical protein
MFFAVQAFGLPQTTIWLLPADCAFNYTAPTVKFESTYPAAGIPFQDPVGRFRAASRLLLPGAFNCPEEKFMAITCELPTRPPLQKTPNEGSLETGGEINHTPLVNDQPAAVHSGDRFAFRVWLACGILLWLVPVVNWLTGIWSR